MSDERQTTTRLAMRYGFADEELDFIISHDIKYRTGRLGDKG